MPTETYAISENQHAPRADTLIHLDEILTQTEKNSSLIDGYIANIEALILKVNTTYDKNTPLLLGF